MKKYKVKNKSLKRKAYRTGHFTLIKKWVKNGIEKCKVADETGYEYVITSDQLEEIKTKSNKKNNKK